MAAELVPNACFPSIGRNKPPAKQRMFFFLKASGAQSSVWRFVKWHCKSERKHGARRSRTVSYNPQVPNFAGCHGAFASYRDSFFLHESFTKFQVNCLQREGQGDQIYPTVLILQTRTRLEGGNKIRLNLKLVMRSRLNSNWGVTQPKSQDFGSTRFWGTAQVVT